MVLRMKLRFETLEMKAFVYASIILTLVLILNLLSRRRKKKIYEFMASLPGPVCFPFIGCGYTLMTMGQTGMLVLFYIFSDKKEGQELFSNILLPTFLMNSSSGAIK